MLDDLVDRALVALGRPPSGTVLITGPVASGKTRAALGLATALRARGVVVGGIAAPRVVDGSDTIGYDLTDLATGRHAPLARLRTVEEVDASVGSAGVDAGEGPLHPYEADEARHDSGLHVGRYVLRAEGLRFAAAAIREAIRVADIVFVDEIGPAELAGSGHAAPVRELVAAGACAVLVVRETLVADVVATFGLQPRANLAVSPGDTAGRSLA